MRRKGTDEQIAIQRDRGLALLEKGKKPKEVAEILNVTRRSENRWQQKARQPKRKKATPLRGRPRKLSDKMKASAASQISFSMVGMIRLPLC